MPTHPRSRTRAALAACTGALTAMFVLAAAPAQASAAPAHGQKATTTKPTVPAAASTPHVRRACGAPRRGHAACMALVRTNVHGHLGLFAAGTTPAGYGPSDLRSAYDLPSATAGSGRTVAIVDAYDDPSAAADLQAYRAQYGLPACTAASGCFEKVNQDGQQGSYPAADAGWAEEESLDLDMVSAICPNCHIILVEADSNGNADLYTAEDEAVALGAQYVSNSWGQCEYTGEQSDDQYFNHPGVAITVASGDYGFDNEAEGCYQPSWPATSQYVTAVGGTSLRRAPGTAHGWTESAWGTTSGTGTGSGCSESEPKPSWQADSGCTNRMTNDVSAVADPATGVAVYDTYRVGGWGVVGGTSVATPIIASTYALAGPPTAGSYPSSYPYADPSALNDVTSGANGSCDPAYSCTAGPGYDGPTGLGTPNGVDAFIGGPHGDISGKVTAKASGKPIAGVTVSTAQGYAATTDAQGDYDLTVPAGSYELTAGEFGYRPASVAGVTAGGGQTVTENFTLAAIRRRTLSGTVTDGSGHGWPLYASITVAGDQATPVYTNPYTGAYHLSLPQGATYQVQITPVATGYQAKAAPVRMGTADLARNFTAAASTSTCTAPGYTWTGGLAQDFRTVGILPPTGWQVADNLGDGFQWRFDDPAHRGNRTGGRGGFAIAENGETLKRDDTTLTSPAFSLAGVATPVVSFHTAFADPLPADNYAEVDLSTDGGHTWTSIWHNSTGVPGHTTEQIPIPQAAGDSQVRIRFHDVANDQQTRRPFGRGFWEVDNVAVGTTPVCSALTGGLIAGRISDGNTGHAVDGAAVTSVASPAQSAATAISPSGGDGFYELFAPGTGGQKFTATDGNYAPATKNANVSDGAVTRQDFTLQAGRLTVSANGVSAAVTMGKSAQRTVRFTNHGTKPVHVSLASLNGGYAPPGELAARPAGAPVQRIKVHAVPGAMTTHPGSVAQTTTPGIRLQQPTPYDAPWTDIANYPLQIADNAVAYDPGSGDVYSFNGWPGGSYSVSRGYVYDPATQQWNPTAAAPIATEQSEAAIVGGTAYLIGGWTNSNQRNAPASPQVYAYDIARNSWSKAASLPAGAAASGVAVLNGQIYMVGGCADDLCDETASVYRYDPASNTSTPLARYPVNDAYPACAGIDGEVVCAGGEHQNVGTFTGLTSTYIYHPASNTWTAGADMPYDDWGMAYGNANGQLQVAGGVSSFEAVNLAAQYDPVTNTWAALPNTNSAEYRGGSACGLYQIGGLNPGSSTFIDTFAQVLPGYDQCGSAAPRWLSPSGTSFTLAPGASATTTVTLNSASLTQPGTYTASLAVGTDSPYEVSPIPVSLTVNPPATWGELTGTVTNAATGNPVPGATLQICTRYSKGAGSCPAGAASYTLKTDDNGDYQLWVARPLQANPLQVIAARQGFAAQVRLVKLTVGAATTASFALSEASASTRLGAPHLSG